MQQVNAHDDDPIDEDPIDDPLTTIFLWIENDDGAPEDAPQALTSQYPALPG